MASMLRCLWQRLFVMMKSLIKYFFRSKHLNNVLPSLISQNFQRFCLFFSLFSVVDIHSSYFSLFIFSKFNTNANLLNSVLLSLISHIFHVFSSFLLLSFTLRLFIFSSSPMPKFEMCNYLLLLTIRSCCCCMRCSWFCQNADFNNSEASFDRISYQQSSFGPDLLVRVSLVMEILRRWVKLVRFCSDFDSKINRLKGNNCIS